MALDAIAIVNIFPSYPRWFTGSKVVDLYPFMWIIWVISQTSNPVKLFRIAREVIRGNRRFKIFAGAEVVGPGGLGGAYTTFDPLEKCRLLRRSVGRVLRRPG